jgi:hypothetical protein
MDSRFNDCKRDGLRRKRDFLPLFQWNISRDLSRLDRGISSEPVSSWECWRGPKSSQHFSHPLFSEAIWGAKNERYGNAKRIRIKAEWSSAFCQAKVTVKLTGEFGAQINHQSWPGFEARVPAKE